MSEVILPLFSLPLKNIYFPSFEGNRLVVKTKQNGKTSDHKDKAGEGSRSVIYELEQHRWGLPVAHICVELPLFLLAQIQNIKNGGGVGHTPTFLIGIWNSVLSKLPCIYAVTDTISRRATAHLCVVITNTEAWRGTPPFVGDLSPGTA